MWRRPAGARSAGKAGHAWGMGGVAQPAEAARWLRRCMACQRRDVDENGGVDSYGGIDAYGEIGAGGGSWIWYAKLG